MCVCVWGGVNPRNKMLIPNPWNLGLCTYLDQRVFANVIKLRMLRWVIIQIIEVALIANENRPYKRHKEEEVLWSQSTVEWSRHREGALRATGCWEQSYTWLVTGFRGGMVLLSSQYKTLASRILAAYISAYLSELAFGILIHSQKQLIHIPFTYVGIRHRRIN